MQDLMRNSLQIPRKNVAGLSRLTKGENRESRKQAEGLLNEGLEGRGLLAPESDVDRLLDKILSVAETLERGK